MNANNTSAAALVIVNDINATLRPGMVVTCQLGNEFDTSWSPSAPLLLLHSNAVMFGDAQFTGIYQRAAGEYFIARFVQEHHCRADHEISERGEKLEIGIMYCTSAVPFDMETKSSSYLSDRENDFLATCLRFHREQLALLPVAPRYKRAELLPVNHGK